MRPMLATYHNHSRWSDGKATVAELIDAAAAMGIDELGVSDHFVIHPAGEEPAWAMRRSRLADYVAELSQYAQRASEAGRAPKVRLGLEVDWFPGHAKAIADAIRSAPLDYVIGSVHYVGAITIDGSPNAWAKMSAEQRNEVHREYWRRMKQLAESRLFNIAAHLDLAKKFGYFATVDLRDVIEPALDALAAAGTVVELNTSGWHKPCADAYPSLEILRMCREREIPVTISADAHQPEHLVRDFDRGAARLREAGFEHVARFQNRTMCLEPIAGAAPGDSA